MKRTAEYVMNSDMFDAIIKSGSKKELEHGPQAYVKTVVNEQFGLKFEVVNVIVK